MNARLPALATAISTVSPSPVVFLHVAVFMAGNKTLSDETFRLVSFQGQESISDHFEYELELHANTSPEHGSPIAFADLVGRPVTAGIHYPAQGDNGESPTREDANQWFQDALNGRDESRRLALFNGIVASCAMEQPGVYRITMRPALWKLTLTNAYRVHAQRNVRDAIEDLLKLHRVDYSVDALVGSDNLAYTRVQDWLQAGESDYDFLQRLMSKAHIYYFVTAGARSHTVVFANRPAYPQAVPSGQPLRYCATAEDELGLAQPDVVSQYSLQQNLSSSAVRSVFTREENCWETDTIATFQSFVASTQDNLGELPFNQYQIYQYGCSDAEVDHYANATQDTLETGRFAFSGASFCPWLRCGHQFTLTQFPHDGQWPHQVRPGLEGLALVATQVQHQASLDGSYTNKFQAADAQGLVTPFSIQETQQGTVLAKVVAHDSAATPAPVNWRWYEKDNFDPETGLARDSDGTQKELVAQGVCVRFSTDGDDSDPVWIKLAPHMQTVPEIGVTVVVTRAQDQSELPEIQSIIHANGTKVIQPSGWTANTNVGSSYSTGYGDGQSIRFGLHSQADLDRATGIVGDQYATGKFREASYSQGASYSYATSETGAPGLLSTSDSFGSTYSTHHGAMNSSTTVFDNTYSESTVNDTATSINTVSGTASNTNTTAVSLSTSTTGTQTSTSLTGASISSEFVGAHTGMSVTGVSGTMSMTGMRGQLSLEGISTNTSLTGESTNTSVTGESNQVNATGASTSVSVTGVASHVSLTGAETGVTLTGSNTTMSLSGATTGMNLIGAQTDMTLVGAATRMSVTGESTSMNVMGDSTDISVSGSTTNMSIKAASTSIDITGGGISVQLAAAMASMHITGLSLDIVELKIYL
jgi:uncharacterized protein involved in type VI secretion and phage assembly